MKFVKVDEPHMVERFLRETRLAASIRNPHVIDMIDFGTTPTGQPVLVMELLEGESLEDILERRSVTAHEAVSVMTQVLVALEAVHAAGIVHGDLKPANVFLSSDGTGEAFVRLIDFGIAYSLDPASNLRRGRNGTDLRTICGTPEYMAPELAECLPDVDARADVYGVGVMLYELLAGVLPFEAEHSGATLFKVMDGKCTPLVSLRPDVPLLAAVVTRAMARERSARPQTAHALRVLLLEAMPVISGSFRVAAPLPEVDEKALSARQQVPTLFEVSPTPWRAKWLGWAIASLTLSALATLTVIASQTNTPLIDLPAPSVANVAVAQPINVRVTALETPTPEPLVALAPEPALAPLDAALDAAPAAEVRRVVPRVLTSSPELDASLPPQRPHAPGLRRALDF